MDATNTVTITESEEQKKARLAVEAAEERHAQVVAKKAAYRIKWQRTYREFLAEQEAERVRKMTEVIEARLGRPRHITEQQLDTVLELHAEGEPLQTSCEALGFSRVQFMTRVRESADLLARLARAREENAHAKVDGAWAIARTEPDVERAKLLTELCRWEVSKVLPHLYGDRLKLEAPDGVVFSMNIGQLVERKEEKLIEGEQLVG
jgi:hypothetical protein